MSPKRVSVVVPVRDRREMLEALLAGLAGRATGTNAGAETSVLVGASPAPSAMPWSCSRTSCAVWSRSSGSLARQPRTTRSSPGGLIGDTCEIGAGSVAMIDEINEAWLFPENALRPVAIS